MAAHDSLENLICLAILRSRGAPFLPAPRLRQLIGPLISRSLGARQVLDLDPLWTTLLQEPDVSERILAAPFVAIETHEALLPVPLSPVTRLQMLGPLNREALRAECPLSAAEVEAILAEPAPALPDAAEEAARKTERGRAARALIEEMAGKSARRRHAVLPAPRPARVALIMTILLLLASVVAAYKFIQTGH